MTKLYCILAREADTAIIFRRGPSKQTCLISWNLKNHTFEEGQWFKGVIYMRKCDLSPDGKKLVYFAAKHGSNLPTWIAVSTPPFLTAHVLWRGMGTWNDISLFETNNSIALATYRAEDSLEPEGSFKLPRDLHVKSKPWPGHFYKTADHIRLVRDGWHVHAGDPAYSAKEPKAPPVTYCKAIHKNTALQMSVQNNGSITFALIQDYTILADLQADWADVRDTELLYSKDGKLFSQLFDLDKPQAISVRARELADFKDIKFKAIEAPGWATQW
jgi:hypothetical protein